MNMTWRTLTVGHFLDLYRISGLDKDEMEKAELAVGAIYSKTPSQVEDLKMSEFLTLSKVAGSFLTGPIPGKAVRNIKVGLKKYKIEYDPKKLAQRQYVEVVHFATEPIENMALIMASIVRPVRFGVAYPNNANHHQDYVEDILKARVIDVYHTCVFFCSQFRDLMKCTLDYLETTKERITKKDRAMIMSSINAMVGFTRPQRSPNTRELV